MSPGMAPDRLARVESRVSTRWRAAFRAEASERGGGLGPERLEAMATAVISTATTGRTRRAISLGVEMRRSRFISGAFRGESAAVSLVKSERSVRADDQLPCLAT